MRNKCLCLFLSVVLSLGLCPIVAFGADGGSSSSGVANGESAGSAQPDDVQNELAAQDSIDAELETSDFAAGSTHGSDSLENIPDNSEDSSSGDPAGVGDVVDLEAANEQNSDASVANSTNLANGSVSANNGEGRALDLSARVSLNPGSYLISSSESVGLFLSSNLTMKTESEYQLSIWSIQFDDDGFAVIQANSSGGYLAVQDDVLKLSSSPMGAFSQWAFLASAQGGYTICNVASGTVLDIAEDEVVTGAHVIAGVQAGAMGQNWILTNLDEQYAFMDSKARAQSTVIPSGAVIYLISALSNTCVVDVNNGSSSNGANVRLYTSNMTAAQQWRVSYDANGYAIFTNVKSGKVLDVANGSMAWGSNVQQYVSNGSRAQKWIIRDNGDGTISLLSAMKSGLVLDVKNGSANAGSNIQIYADNGTKAQKWVAATQQQQYQKLDSLAANSFRVADNDEVFLIKSSLSATGVVDVSDGSMANGANVQLYVSNMTTAQQWRISYDSKGYATISNVKSGNVLDVANGSAVPGANVQQYVSNGTRSQKWIVRDNGDGTISFLSALWPGLVLDVSNGSANPGSNIQVYSDNGTKAQKWSVLQTEPEVSPCKNLGLDGRYYEVLPKSNSSLTLDVQSASTSNGASIQLYVNNGTLAQLFTFEFVSSDGSNGYYRIVNARSGKVLDVAGGNLVPTTAIQQWGKESNNDNQLFAIQSNSDGSYTFINKATGLAVDVQNGSVASGKKVWAYTRNSSSSQRFTLREKSNLLQEGLFIISSALNSNKVLDIANGSASAGANVQLYESNGTIAQKWQVIRVGNNLYSFQSLVSGLYLTADSNGNVAQRAKTGNGSQYWVPSISGGHFVLKNQANGKVLTVNSGNTANGTRILTAGTNQTRSQGFDFSSTEPLANATYHILSVSNKSLTIDVANGSSGNGANVQAYQKNGTGAQKWDFSRNSDGSYTILNSQSKKALDVANGKAASGANVQQYVSNGTAAQRWQVVYNSDGSFRIASKLNSNLVLTIDGALSNGANISIRQYTGSANQKFTFEKTTYVPPIPANLQAMMNRAAGYSSGTRYLILVNRAEHLVGVFSGSRGNWTMIYHWSCVVGKPSTPTITGTYRTTGFKRPHLTTDSRAIYCTQINGGYFFHSILVSTSELGNSLSHGCVRLPYDAAYWIYTNVGAGTTVSIYN